MKSEWREAARRALEKSVEDFRRLNAELLSITVAHYNIGRVSMKERTPEYKSWNMPELRPDICRACLNTGLMIDSIRIENPVTGQLVTVRVECPFGCEGGG